MLSAVIFDFDGVIVDTEPLHFEAFGRVLKPLGLDFGWDDYIAHYVGYDDRDAFREAGRNAGRPIDEVKLAELIRVKAEAFESVVKERGADPVPGAERLIRQLSAKVPLGLCSGALRRDIELIMRPSDLLSMFRVIVTTDDVSVSKPDPGSYRLVVERLARAFPDRSIAAQDCVAIEDTPAGIDAARAAGLKVLALSKTYPPDKLAKASRVVGTLEGLDLEDITALVRS